MTGRRRSEWISTLALFAFPVVSRDRYGRDMAQLLDDHCRAARDEGRPVWRIWLMGIWDIVIQGFGERWEDRRRQRKQPRRPRESRMRDALVQDLRFAVRQIGKNPTFAAVAIITLALGIGANTAVFSVINGVILRPLPYPAPQDLVRVWTRFLPESGYEGEEFTLSPREGVEYADATRAMEHVAIYDWTSTALTGDGTEPTRLAAAFVDEGFFPLLRRRPHLGRWFTPEELAPNGPRAAILTHGLWTSRFGEDASVVGRTIVLDGQAVEIVGVMPAGFDFPNPDVRIYLPFQLDRAAAGGWGWHGINVIARLAPGYTLPQAEAELASLNEAWREEYGHPQTGHTLYLASLHQATVGDVAETLWMLMAAVVLVLLIASANVANLLMARGESRTREVSLRVALGASRGRIVKQLLTESLVLALAGAALGVGLAVAGVRAALLINPDVLPRAEAIAIDLPVLAFTMALTVGSALIFGLAPAIQTGARSRGASLGTESRSSESRSRKRVRSILVAGEVALSVIVVLSAALVGRSFAALTSVDSGFQETGRLSFGISLPEADYGSVDEVRVTVEELADRLRAVPGVTSASYTSSLPITGPLNLPDFNIEGRPRPSSGERMLSAQTFVVLPGFMETMGIRLQRGRAFSPTDDENGQIVALIDAEAARVFWPGQDPLNQRLGFGFPVDSIRWATIIGVVDNTLAEGPDREIRPQIYLPFAQQQGFWMATSRTGSFILKTEGEPTMLVEGARRAVAAVNTNLPLSDIRPMDDIVSRSVAQPRLISALLGSFAVIALMLSMVGVYGVVSYSVARRTREIGIRLALGANMTRVVRMMIREGAAPAVTGLGLGLVGALAVTSLMSDMLFHVSPTDPTTFIVFPTILAAVSMFASWLPSRRATRVAPTEALREE